MLNVAKLDAFYGKKQVLFGIDMMLAERSPHRGGHRSEWAGK